LTLTAYVLLAGCGLPLQQPPKVPRIGYIGVGAVAPNTALLEAFRQGMRDLGYVEGQNVVIDYRLIEGSLDRAPVVAAELAGLTPDLIVATGLESAIAAKNATATIPIVGFLGPDPVATGLVESLARPGGNVTGVSAGPTIGFAAKTVQILAEAAPGRARVAVLWNARNIPKVAEIKEMQETAPAYGLRLQSVEVRRDEDFDGAFPTIAGSGTEALMVLQDPLMAAHSAQIIAFAMEHRLPAIYETRLVPDAGGLMSYGTPSLERYHRIASYVDRVLKGARPAVLPVELPTTYEFVINLKAAETIGLTIPTPLLQRATDIIR